MNSVPGAGRYLNIDVLRGVAALLVLWLHAAEVFVTVSALRAVGTAAHDISSYLQAGRAGVIAFFAISGFVIPVTITPPRLQGSIRFAIKRFLRLYPAFWLALLLSYYAIWAPQGKSPSAADLIANLTMVPTLFGIEGAVGHFWTLEIEIVFYVLVVALFWRRYLHRPWIIATLCCVLALKPAALLAGSAAWTAGQGHWAEAPLCLAIMLWGSLLRRSYDPRASVQEKLRGWCNPPTLVATTFVVGRSLNLGGLVRGVDASTYFAGLGTFWGLLLFLVFALVNWNWPRWLVWFGTVSYSIYLFHPVVLYPTYFLVLAHPSLAVGSAGVWVVVVAVATIALASVTYLFVEAPANRLATRLTRLPSSLPTRAAI